MTRHSVLVVVAILCSSVGAQADQLRGSAGQATPNTAGAVDNYGHLRPNGRTGVPVVSLSRLEDRPASGVSAHTSSSVPFGGPLDQVQILGLLVSTESSQYLARLIQHRGLCFSPSPLFVDMIREAGGEAVLVAALHSARSNAVVSACDRALQSQLVELVSRGAQMEKKGPRFFQEAEQQYRSALDLDPASPVLRIVLGHILATQGRGADAAAQFREAVRVWPRSAVAHCDLGYALMIGGDIDGGIQEQRLAIQLEPSYADAHGHLGGDLLMKNEQEAGIAELSQAVQVQPDLNTWRLQLAGALMSKGDVEGAIAQYRDAVRIAPEDPNVLVTLGAAFAAKDDWADAQTQFDRARHIKPADPNIYLRVGFAFSSRGKWDEALDAYRESVRLNPTNSFAHLQVGSTLDKKGDHAAALAEYQEATRVAGDDASLAPIWSALATEARWDDVIAVFREAVQLRPNSGYAHLDLGQALMNKSDVASATNEFREAVRLMPADAVAHSDLSWALGWKGDFDEAVSEANEAVKLAPNLAVAHANLSFAFNSKGDFEAGAKEAREAIRLFPDFTAAHNDLGWALEHKGDRQGALDEYRKAYMASPTNPGTRANYERLLKEPQPLAASSQLPHQSTTPTQMSAQHALPGLTGPPAVAGSIDANDPLIQAQTDFSTREYGKAVQECERLLTSQPDNLEANRLAGLSYYMLGLTSNSPDAGQTVFSRSYQYLAKVIASGGEVSIPVKHLEVIGLDQQFCNGYLTVTNARLRFHSNTNNTDDFDVPLTQITELQSGGCLHMKISTWSGKKEKKRNYNFFPTMATLVPENVRFMNTSIATHDTRCDSAACESSMSVLYQLMHGQG
jgi:tetratricopeptide (TPR) repeat protein